MTKEEYHFRISEVNKQAQDSITRIQQEFAYSNNKVSLGQFIRQNGFTIQVDRIGVYITGERIPVCSYHGYLFTAEKKQRKDKRRHNIYNISEIETL